MMKYSVSLGLGLVGIAALSAMAASQLVKMAGGDTARVECSGAKLDTTSVNATTLDLTCQPVPVPPGPDMVPLPSGDSNDMRFWHPAKAHDGLNPHEHGDAPPQWVLDWSQANLGSTQLFGWQPVETPNENYMKHQAYKGARGAISGVNVYLLHHSQSNPMDWPAPYHSWRLWVRDAQGGVSYLQGRMYFGWPDVRTHRLGRAEEEPGYYGPSWPGRGQFIIGCRMQSDTATCEQWYGFAGDRAIHLSVTICGAAAICDPDNLQTMDAAMDMSTWDLTGSQGTSRRYEISWYGPTSQGIESPRYNGWWCQQVAPTEPAHTHYSLPAWAHYAPAEGPNQCKAGFAPQYTSPTMPTSGIYYKTGNTFTRSFSSAGLAQPQ